MLFAAATIFPVLEGAKTLLRAKWENSEIIIVHEIIIIEDFSHLLRRFSPSFPTPQYFLNWIMRRVILHTVKMESVRMHALGFLSWLKLQFLALY